MKKTELVRLVSNECEISIKDTEKVVSTLFDLIGNQLANGEKIQIADFGTFETRKSNERTGVNPKTGEKILIPSRMMPKFKAAKKLKSKIEN